MDKLFSGIKKLQRLSHPEFNSGSLSSETLREKMLNLPAGRQVQHDNKNNNVTIKQFNNDIFPLLILEHSAEVTEEEIKKEITLIEKYLQ